MAKFLLKFVDQKDGTLSFSVPLSPAGEVQQSFANGVLHEEREYDIYLRPADNNTSLSELRSATLYLNDNSYSLQSFLNGHFEGSTWRSGHRFWGELDGVRPEVTLVYLNGRTATLITPPILFSYENADELQHISDILNALMSFDDPIVSDWLFASRERGGVSEHEIHKRVHEQLEQLVELLRMIADGYTRHSRYFRHHARHKVQAQRTMLAADSVRTVSHDDIMWLAQNTDVLYPIHTESGICTKGQHYLPLQMESGLASRNCDIYENRVVLAFLKRVLMKIMSYTRELEEHLREAENFLGSISHRADSINSPIVTTRRLLIGFMRERLEQLTPCIREISTLLAHYSSFLKCEQATLLRIPRSTGIFLGIPAYRDIYRLIREWFEFGEPGIDNSGTVFNLKSLTKLYEYYCLQRLLQQMKEEGFTACPPAPGKEAAYTYSYLNHPSQYENETSVANTYHFTRGKAEVTLYYEPSISDVAFENGLNLYRLHRERKWGPSHYTPDFVLKIRTAEHTDYFILDAKFAKSHKIPERLTEVILKYFAGLGTSSPQERITMVWTLQGRVDEHATVGNYINTPMARRYPPPFSFGNCPVNPTPDDGLKKLFKHMYSICPELAAT